LATARGATQHMHSVHSSCFPHKCAYTKCMFSSATQQELDKHVYDKHESPRPFECLQCEYKTKEPANIKQHVERVHVKGGKGRPQIWAATREAPAENANDGTH